jgi:ADP-ribose pyrophosphatase YjhB (NUDIX family)
MRPRTPEITVDAIIENSAGEVVLVERRFAPSGWALPGGFVDPGESLAQAARRESLEETGLSVEILSLFHVYSRPWRDPRGDTISVVYHCISEGIPSGGDDAASAGFFSLNGLPETIAFDHRDILRDFAVWKATGRKPSLEA